MGQASPVSTTRFTSENGTGLYPTDAPLSEKCTETFARFATIVCFCSQVQTEPGSSD